MAKPVGVFAPALIEEVDVPVRVSRCSGLTTCTALSPQANPSLMSGSNTWVLCVRVVEERIDVTDIAELGAGEGNGCGGRLHSVFPFYANRAKSCPLDKDMLRYSERPSYFRIARRTLPPRY